MFKIYNEDCLHTMERMSKENTKVDVILTSPPYNISRGVSTEEEISKHKSKYKDFKDNMPNEEYREFIINVVNHYDTILKDNGVVLFNVSYASCVETDSRCSDMIKLMYDIVMGTNFDIADIIIWKKKSALPNNRSSNKLTRIVEYVFVLCRKDEYSTFKCNKKLVSFNEDKNLRLYENVFNFVEAKNNDGINDLNKATYSVELCEKLLNVYAQPNSVIYDSFNGTGTTGVAALKLGHSYIGSEISKEQCEFSINRLSGNVGESNHLAHNNDCVKLW